jgi:hypothetical protein
VDLCLPFAPDGSRLSHKAAVVNEYRVVSKSDLGLLDNPRGGLAEQAVDFSVRANVCRVGCGAQRKAEQSFDWISQLALVGGKCK